MSDTEFDDLPEDEKKMLDEIADELAKDVENEAKEKVPANLSEMKFDPKQVSRLLELLQDSNEQEYMSLEHVPGGNIRVRFSENGQFRIFQITASGTVFNEGDRLAWAEVLEQSPDAAVVTDAKLRGEIERTGLPWRVKDKGTGIELLLVPPGKYRRGASVGDGDAEEKEQPAHEVTLTQPFYLGRYEVTQAQWQAAMGSNPSTKSKDPQAPVETVSHDDIANFNQKTGLRLPTEAEWEYACRAGSTAARYGELDDVAWHDGNSDSTTQPVGQKRANALGFHDMLGNVWEWCSDWYSDSEYARCSAGVVDPKGPSTGDSRVLRGGSWCFADGYCRASSREPGGPANRGDDYGFRVSRSGELKAIEDEKEIDETIEKEIDEIVKELEKLFERDRLE